MTARLAMGLLLALAAGCFARNAAEPRFFRPDSALLREPAAEIAPAAPSRSVVAIRLRAVEGGSFLRERIVWRASSVEYGVYEQRRWREVPASYVERALRSALRRTAGVRFSDDPRVASLRVEVTAFDEVLAPAHVAVVEAAVSLRDKNGQLLLDAPFSAEAPIADDDPVTMARAMGGALDRVAPQIAEAVAKAVVPRK
jgi:uncharacterized lipoprotein YmbA